MDAKLEISMQHKSRIIGNSSFYFRENCDRNAHSCQILIFQASMISDFQTITHHQHKLKWSCFYTAKTYILVMGEPNRGKYESSCSTSVYRFRRERKIKIEAKMLILNIADTVGIEFKYVRNPFNLKWSETAYSSAICKLIDKQSAPSCICKRAYKNGKTKTILLWLR